MKFIVCFSALFVCSFAADRERLYIWSDERFPEHLRNQMQNFDNFDDEFATENIPLTLALAECLSVAEDALPPPKDDSGPMASLLIFKDNLCLNTSHTLTCYEKYLSNLTDLAQSHRSSADVAALKPLESILSIICDPNGIALKIEAKHVFNCVELKFSSYVDCFEMKTGPKLQTPFRPGGIVPYFYSFSCRTIPTTEKCVRRVSAQCGLSAKADELIGELFNGIRKTPICADAPTASKYSFIERVYQSMEITDCWRLRQTNVWTSIGACANVTESLMREVRDDLLNETISNTLRKLCPNLPYYKTCFENQLELMTLCHVGEYRHFDIKGLEPLFSLADYLCDGYGRHFEDLFKILSNSCLTTIKMKDMEEQCADVIVKKWIQKTPLPLPAAGYLDYEMLEDVKVLHRCLVENLATCGPGLVRNINGAFEIVISELNANVINYDL